jgi:N-acylneuraminate cytidylyltransferase
MVDGELIDMTVETVQSTDADSAMTVWRAEDDHPQRAMKLNECGYLTHYDGEYDAKNTNRQNYEDIYFYDNGPWTLEADCVEDRNGPGAWWWMGERCVPVEREWVTGRDIHDYFDVAFQEFYVRNRDELRELEQRRPQDKSTN